MARTGLAALPSVAAGLVVMLAFHLIGRALSALTRRGSARLGRAANVGIVLGRLIRAGLLGLGLLVASTIVFPSFKVSSLVQVLGITGVAAGFAFRDILQNFLAGILILWTQPFRIGDQIIHDDIEGTVEDIQTRATYVHTYDGRRIVVPNAQLFTNAVTVNTAHGERRVEQEVGIGVADSIDDAKAIVRATLASLPEVLREPSPDVLVVALGDFAVRLRVRWWIRPPRHGDLIAAQDSVLTAMKRDLLAGGIDLPFPTTRVLISGEQPP